MYRELNEMTKERQGPTPNSIVYSDRIDCIYFPFALPFAWNNSKNAYCYNNNMSDRFSESKHSG